MSGRASGREIWRREGVARREGSEALVEAAPALVPYVCPMLLFYSFCACIRFSRCRPAGWALSSEDAILPRRCSYASLLLRLVLVYPFRRLTIPTLSPPPSSLPPSPPRPPLLLLFPLRRRPLPLLPMPDFADPEQARRGDDGREEREPGCGVERGVQAGVDGRERSRALCDAMFGRRARGRGRERPEPGWTAVSRSPGVVLGGRSDPPRSGRTPARAARPGAS